MKIFFLVICVAFGASFAEYNSKELRCLVCRATVKEMTDKIEKVNPKKKIQVGGFRVDETGQLQEKLVPFARSGMHLSELMDEVCKAMEDYVRATDKKTKTLNLLKLVIDGKMNPDFSNYDIVQDNDLNKTLEFYCEGIVEEFEEEIFNELKEPTGDPINSVCTRATHLCDSEDKDEL